MKPKQEKTADVPQFVQRRGFYLDILKYAETLPIPLGAELTSPFLEAYDRLKSSLGHASYTEISRALKVTPLEVMQHVKHMHVHSKEWEVRFLNNRHNENVLFKLISKNS